MTTTVRKNIRQACDACKIRKIKCSELPPCEGCIAAGIPCTKKNKPGTRGPRSLRPKTIREIAQRQQGGNGSDSFPEPNGKPPPTFNSDHARPVAPPSERNPQTPIDSLVLRLCVYRLRLFPVWPIIAVEEIMGTLQSDKEDMEMYALANAVGAATMAQLKLDISDNDPATGSSMEAECQRTKVLTKAVSSTNLNTLRISFFLHVYHENQEAGGTKSLLYLREAITMAQIMGLHRESTYLTLPQTEQQIRRRILWLLFVTERGVAMLHKLPVVLKPNILFPAMDSDDETHILPAFQRLTNLFWLFDQSGAFDILQNSDADILNFGGIESSNRNCLEILQKRLENVPLDRESTNDVQKADICVTRQWMRAVIWRASMNHGRFSTPTSLSHPVQIAKEFLGVISKIPKTALEAHGPSMEFKIFEIASAVIDTMANSVQAWSTADSPQEVLSQLHRTLVSCRGGNKFLVSTLCNRIAELQDRPRFFIEPSSRVVEIEDQWLSETFPAAALGRLVSISDQGPHQLSDGDTAAREENATSLGFNNMEGNMLQGTGNLSWESDIMNNLLSSVQNEEYG